MAAGTGSALRSLAGAVVRSPRVRLVASFPFRMGPADSDWKGQPFAGLAVVNNLSGIGDALVTVALAGSVFVSVSLNAARGRTALASGAKTAFDAIVQRDTPDRDRSRLFARFESIFQLGWVAGALVPTIVATPLLAGYILTAAVVLGTSAVFVAGLNRDDGAIPPDGSGPLSSPPVPARTP